MDGNLRLWYEYIRMFSQRLVLIQKFIKVLPLAMGVDRLAMLKYGISDLRAFFNSDLRWLKHYGFSALNIPSLAAGLTKREGI